MSIKSRRIPLKIKWDKDGPEVISTVSLMLTDEQYQEAMDRIHRKCQ